MNRINQLLFFAVFGLISGIHPVWAEGNLIPISQQQIENLGIKTGKLTPASHIPLFSAPAKVVVPPANDFIVSASLAGLVVKMNANVGDKVAKGEELGLINSSELLTLQGNYLKSVGALKLATATYKRDKTLKNEGVVSGRSEQESYSIYNASVIEANEAKQLLQIVGMTANEIKELESAGHLVSRIRIRSPISGNVVERMAVTGSRIDSQSPLYRIANLDELWLEINIPQEHIDQVKLGEKVLVEGGSAEAEIKILGHSVNPDNQTVLARALIIGNPGSVRLGQKVTIQHMQGSVTPTYLLNDEAITHHQGKAYLFVKEKDGFVASEIKVLGQQSGSSVISGNLTGNEEVAVNNTVALKAQWLGLGGAE